MVRASFAAYDVEFVVEISRCRAPLHRSTCIALSRAGCRALQLYSALQRSTLYFLYTPSLSRNLTKTPEEFTAKLKKVSLRTFCTFFL